MKTILFLNADEDGTIAKTILAGCYKFGCATLLRQGGATMTSVIEIYDSRDKGSRQGENGGGETPPPPLWRQGSDILQREAALPARRDKRYDYNPSNEGQPDM